MATGSLPDPRNQPGEHRRPRQHDALAHQVRGGQIKQHAGPHGAGEHLGVKPAGQAECLPALKGTKTQVRHQVCLVVMERVRSGIPAVPGLCGQVQLLGQGLHHDSRHPGGNGQKRAQKPQRTQLHGTPELGVGPAVAGQELDILRTQVKETG